ncbi:hypothetical protein [uncultured Thiodictyon sp.]|uniref:hypothetical protein n=1 Tax=uncultured Thiodictyon sp. TaxID=1846217 RepID=UPI0025F7DE6F|nr:hypothetical protein [uncultured Thiodictyon sp.]
MARRVFSAARTQDLEEELNDFYDARKKSLDAAFLLPLVLGPIGTLYGNPLGGAVLILSSGLVFAYAIVGSLAAASVGVFFWAGLLVWVIAITLGGHGAYRHNLSVRSEAALWRRLIESR